MEKIFFKVCTPTADDAQSLSIFNNRLTTHNKDFENKYISFPYNDIKVTDIASATTIYVMATCEQNYTYGYIAGEMHRYNNNKAMVIKGLYVDKKYRGKGIGAALLNKISAIAKANGCTQIQASIVNGDAYAIDFFKGYGFKPVITTLAIDVEDD